MRHEQYQALKQEIDPVSTPSAAVSHALLTMLGRGGGLQDHDVAKELGTALRRWPDDIDLAWFHWWSCGQGSGCNRQAALATLLENDADNAMAWMAAMAAAREQGKSVDYRRFLARAASARFYDSRMGVAFLHLRPLLARAQPPASCMAGPVFSAMAAAIGRTPTVDDYAEIEAASVDLMAAVPPLHALSDCMSDEFQSSEATRGHCMRLLARVAEADTLFEQRFALGLLIELSPDGDEAAELRERYRGLLWLSTMNEAANQPGFVVRSQSDGEVEALRNHAIATGRWPPPRDWLPEDASSRALILGGDR